MAKRSPDFRLDVALGDPGFTPSVRDTAGLVGLVAGSDGAYAEAAARALARIDGPIAARVSLALGALGEIAPAARRSVLAALVPRAGREEERDDLARLALDALASASPAVRGAAAGLLGRVERHADALADALERESDPATRKALVEALGRVGGPSAKAALARADLGGGGPALRLERARMWAERSVARAHSARVDPDRSFDGPLRMTVRCRRGLEDCVLEELHSTLTAMAARRARVDGVLPPGTPLSALWMSRTSLGFALLFEEPRLESDDEATAVARLLAADRTLQAWLAVAGGAARYRLAWADGSKHRGRTWRTAHLVSERAPALVNDPREADWEVFAAVDDARVRLEIAPALDDPRFAYRVRDVPAASHPTIAAALVHVAGVRPDDVVWDPFVGSGLELCERAIAGPYARLLGTDRDPTALERARANVDSLRADRVELRAVDARRAELPPLDLVITNPPMGRRVLPGFDLDALMGDVIARACAHLAPNGRIVLLSPCPRTTRDVAADRGLACTRRERVDLGGFDAELQRLERG